MKFGKVTGLEKPVSRLVHGTIMLSSEEVEKGFELLDAVYAAGCRCWDSAHIYGGGDCERVLGQWSEARGNREGIVVLTKGCHHTSDRRRVTPYDLTSELFDSLARLRTDYIDIYVLHRDDPNVSVGPIVETLNEHHAAGRIRAFGGSNWETRRIAEANEYADKHSMVPFAVSSPNFSLAEQFDEPWPDCVTISGSQKAADRAWYAKERMPLFCWSSMGQGFFSGRISRANWESAKENFPEPVERAYAHELNFQRLDRVDELAREKGMTVPQVALAWVVQQPELDIFALIGTLTGVEFSENLKALEIELTKEELEWLDLRRASR